MVPASQDGRPEIPPPEPCAVPAAAPVPWRWRCWFAALDEVSLTRAFGDSNRRPTPGAPSGHSGSPPVSVRRARSVGLRTRGSNGAPGGPWWPWAPPSERRGSLNTTRILIGNRGPAREAVAEPTDCCRTGDSGREPLSRASPRQAGRHLPTDLCSCRSGPHASASSPLARCHSIRRIERLPRMTTTAAKRTAPSPAVKPPVRSRRPPITMGPVKPPISPTA